MPDMALLDSSIEYTDLFFTREDLELILIIVLSSTRVNMQILESQFDTFPSNALLF